MNPGTEQRRVAAILFTNIVGYNVPAAEGAVTANGVEIRQWLGALHVNTQGAQVP